MSGKIFECGYGAILAEDVEVLEACLSSVLADRNNGIPIGRPQDVDQPVRICEIGMHDGGTARGIERFLSERNTPIAYFGVDPDPGTSRPRHVPDGGKVIVGYSEEVFPQVPSDLDLLWVDGCHCMRCVVMDVLHYTPKVRPGGYVCFHDVNPKGEGAEHQYHGPMIPEFGLAVNQALHAIRFPWPNWAFFMERVPTDVHNCGTRAYRRIW